MSTRNQEFDSFEDYSNSWGRESYENTKEFLNEVVEHSTANTAHRAAYTYSLMFLNIEDYYHG